MGSIEKFYAKVKEELEIHIGESFKCPLCGEDLSINNFLKGGSGLIQGVTLTDRP